MHSINIVEDYRFPKNGICGLSHFRSHKRAANIDSNLSDFTVIIQNIFYTFFICKNQLFFLKNYLMKLFFRSFRNDDVFCFTPNF